MSSLRTCQRDSWTKYLQLVLDAERARHFSEERLSSFERYCLVKYLYLRHAVNTKLAFNNVAASLPRFSSGCDDHMEKIYWNWSIEDEATWAAKRTAYAHHGAQYLGPPYIVWCWNFLHTHVLLRGRFFQGTSTCSVCLENVCWWIKVRYYSGRASCVSAGKAQLEIEFSRTTDWSVWMWLVAMGAKDGQSMGLWGSWTALPPGWKVQLH